MAELRLADDEQSLGVESSSGEARVSDSGRKPRGLGVSEGVGRLCAADERFSGVRDKGRRLRLAGRGREGVGFVTARTGVTGVEDVGRLSSLRV
jgi:hypothetical protein